MQFGMFILFVCENNYSYSYIYVSIKKLIVLLFIQSITILQ